MKASKVPQYKDSNIDDISGFQFDNYVFLRLSPYLKPHRSILFLSFFFICGSTAIALFGPQLLGYIIDQALIPRDAAKLLVFSLLYIALELIRLLIVYAQSVTLQRIGQRVMSAVRSDLFNHLLRMHTSFFDRNPVGKLVTRVTNDTVNLSELFSANFVMLISDIFLIIGVITAMIGIHLKLGLITISVFPVMIFAMSYFAHRLRYSFRLSRGVLSRLNSFFAECVSGMPIVQLMQREEHERKSYQNLSEEYFDRQTESVYLYSLFHPTITVLAAVSVVLVLYFGPKYYYLREIPLGTFVSYLAYVQILYQPVRNITDRYNVFLAAMSSAERIFSLLDMKLEDGIEPQVGAAPGKFRGDLRFQSVDFSYPVKSGRTDAETIRDLSFHVSAGETLAIVGPTGAGKSTIISLLFRLYEPASGKIWLDDQELSKVAKELLRSKIGYVQQDVFLFSGTVRENLTLFSGSKPDSEIFEACRISGFDRVLQRMPNGLESLLEERGSNLSLGERQTLAIARVVIQNPELLILDEATSSVDPNLERKIQEATQLLTQNKTCIIIAHRLETIRKANKVLVLNRGRVIEFGSPEKLLEQPGMFRKFVEMQRIGAR